MGPRIAGVSMSSYSQTPADFKRARRKTNLLKGGKLMKGSNSLPSLSSHGGAPGQSPLEEAAQLQQAEEDEAPTTHTHTHRH